METNNYRIAGYTRISIDIESDKDKNTSIENQKAIISDYCRKHFPNATLDFFVDRDRSGYTFDKREDFQRLRGLINKGEYDILIFKDFSRFSRRNSEGLFELEKLKDAGQRVISILDYVDFKDLKAEDWLNIQFKFLMNEQPVRQSSQKVKATVENRQEDGRWVCNVPYGYVMIDTKKMIYRVDPFAAGIVRTIFRLYLDGYGYKRIANYLTENNIPTPKTTEKTRFEEQGKEYKGKFNAAWNPVTISEILVNDFYIGTLRQHKYTRSGINKKDKKVDESEHKVFYDRHEAIVDKATFDAVQDQLKNRTTTHYRGVKKYDTRYSGFLFCGDCDSPMFSMSRRDLAPAYTCGTYHRRGLAGCTSHHIRMDFLDVLLVNYIRRVRDNSHNMLEALNGVLSEQRDNIGDSEQSAKRIQKQLDRQKDMLRVYMKQKAAIELSDDMSQDDKELELDAVKSLIDECKELIKSLNSQLDMLTDKIDATEKVNQVAKTVLDVFDHIIKKDKLDREDIIFLVDRIVVYEDHVDIKLKSDIDELLRTTAVTEQPEMEQCANFNFDTEDIEKTTIELSMVVAQSAKNQRDKVFCVNVIKEGDPLEIYTDREGEVIFKKYSPIGELSSFASKYAETLYKTCNLSVIISDRDAVIASAGVSKKEYSDKNLSEEVEKIIEGRGFYSWREGTDKLPVIADSKNHFVRCAMPIISEGDVIGCVASVADSEADKPQRDNVFGFDAEAKLIQTAAGFLGRHTEA